MAQGELDFIASLRTVLGPDPRLTIGPGDDTALVPIGSRGGVLATVDTVMDGVHFHLAEAGPRRVGHKALAVNLSDVAAMGGIARAALVALCLPRQGAGVIAPALMEGMRALAERFDVAIAGGDTNSWDGPLVVSVTLLGEPHAKGAVTRSGAKPGDAIVVTGALGGSIAGRHLDFMPRLDEARWLMDHCHVSAMIDVSDGLATDLQHIARESGARAVLDPKLIPIAAAVKSDGDPLARAMTDGEDFELCFTLPAAEAAELQSRADRPCPMTIIGRVEAGAPGLFWQTPGGLIEVGGKGFEHSFK